MHNIDFNTAEQIFIILLKRGMWQLQQVGYEIDPSNDDADKARAQLIDDGEHNPDISVVYMRMLKNGGSLWCESTAWDHDSSIVLDDIHRNLTRLNPQTTASLLDGSATDEKCKQLLENLFGIDCD